MGLYRSGVVVWLPLMLKLSYGSRRPFHSVHQIVCNGGRLGIKNMCSGLIPTQITDSIIVVRYVSENAKAPPVTNYLVNTIDVLNHTCPKHIEPKHLSLNLVWGHRCAQTIRRTIFFCPYAIAVVFTNVRKLVLSGFSRRDRADLRLDGAWSLELPPLHSQST